MAELSIILVNYRGARDSVECVRSLRRSSYRSFETIIVDNGSGDGSVDYIARECPDTVIIANAANLGFAEGNNVGIRLALKGDCRYILLLNNDTVVEPDTLKELIETFHRHSDAGIVGGKIRYFDRPDVIWFAGGVFNPNSGFGRHVGIGKVDRGTIAAETACDYITGCCLLARREVFENVGLLAPEYFAYLEDADFCLQARRAGYGIVFQPRAVLYHKVSRSTSWDSPLYVYFALRNKLLFLRRNTAVHRWIPHVPRLLYFYARQLMRLTLRRRGHRALRAAWYGIVDGLRNRTGTFGKGRLAELLE